MRAIIVLLSATAALATPGTPGDVPINCARANANYCMGADIILRCDSNAIGTPGRCTPNLSGYPPAGGVANCWQSSEEAGDAACEKNCVVYADPPFTLTDCNPTPTPSHPFPNTTITTVTTHTTTFCSEGCTHTPPPPPPPPGNGTTTPPPGNGTAVPPPDSTAPPPPGGTTTGGGEPTTPPPPPGTEPPPSAAVVANKASTFFAAVGIVIAYFI